MYIRLHLAATLAAMWLQSVAGQSPTTLLTAASSCETVNLSTVTVRKFPVYVNQYFETNTTINIGGVDLTINSAPTSFSSTLLATEIVTSAVGTSSTASPAVGGVTIPRRPVGAGIFLERAGFLLEILIDPATRRQKRQSQSQGFLTNDGTNSSVCNQDNVLDLQSSQLSINGQFFSTTGTVANEPFVASAIAASISEGFTFDSSGVLSWENSLFAGGAARFCYTAGTETIYSVFSGSLPAGCALVSLLYSTQSACVSAGSAGSAGSGTGNAVPSSFGTPIPIAGNLGLGGTPSGNSAPSDTASNLATDIPTLGNLNPSGVIAPSSAAPTFATGIPIAGNLNPSGVIAASSAALSFTSGFPIAGNLNSAEGTSSSAGPISATDIPIVGDLNPSSPVSGVFPTSSTQRFPNTTIPTAQSSLQAAISSFPAPPLLGNLGPGATPTSLSAVLNSILSPTAPLSPTSVASTGSSIIPSSSTTSTGSSIIPSSSTTSTGSSGVSSSSSSTTSSAAPTPTIPLAVGVYNYSGCFLDGDQDGIFALGAPVHVSGSMTVASCAVSCQNYAYFGLVLGNICYCSATLGVSSIDLPTANTFCDSPCTGNNLQFCGGAPAGIGTYLQLYSAPEESIFANASNLILANNLLPYCSSILGYTTPVSTIYSPTTLTTTIPSTTFAHQSTSFQPITTLILTVPILTQVITQIITVSATIRVTLPIRATLLKRSNLAARQQTLALPAPIPAILSAFQPTLISSACSLQALPVTDISTLIIPSTIRATAISYIAGLPIIDVATLALITTTAFISSGTLTTSTTTTTTLSSTTTLCSASATPVLAPPTGAVCGQQGQINPGNDPNNAHVVGYDAMADAGACYQACLNVPGCKSYYIVLGATLCQLWNDTTAGLGFQQGLNPLYMAYDINCYNCGG